MIDSHQCLRIYHKLATSDFIEVSFFAYVLFNVY